MTKFNLSEYIIKKEIYENTEDKIRVGRVRTFIKKDTELIADYMSGKMTANEFWDERNSLAGKELSR